MVPAVAVALADVASDALMIERSQPLGLTGPLQAVQWGCLYAAGIVTGLLGGTLCEDQREYAGFPDLRARGPADVRPGAPLRPRARARLARRRGGATRSARSPRARSMLPIGAFLFLWNFNPFSNTVLHLHMTRALGFSERFYGRTVALTAVVSIVASVAYGLYCRRIRMSILVHLSIILGVVSTLGYGAVVDERSALLVTVGVAFTYMTATLIQLDLAARTCPPETAGTVFALLMALENLSALGLDLARGHPLRRGQEPLGEPGQLPGPRPDRFGADGLLLAGCPALARDERPGGRPINGMTQATRGSNRDWVRMIARSSGKE